MSQKLRWLAYVDQMKTEMHFHFYTSPSLTIASIFQLSQIRICVCLRQGSKCGLHLAARGNDTETLQRLISAGADVNVRDAVSI